MSPALKQRLIGAAVLIALAVIFLPMLIKGPAPASGLPDMSLDVPDAPTGDYKTVDLPLIAPPPAREGGALAGAPLSEAAPAAPAATRPDGSALPTVDTSAQDNPLPATVAGGGYAVHYAAFASEADAEAILRQLGESGLRGYRESFTLNGKPAQRVRLGPYANRADAEIVRVRAAQVRDDVTPRVVALDAGARPDVPRPATPAPTTTPTAPAASRPTAAPTPATPTTEQLPEEAPAARTPARTPPAQTPPAATPATPPAPPAAAPTSGTGFIVQLGAFSNAAEANRLRDRLRGAGITAFTDSVDTDKGRLTRVKAGPVASRGEADQLKTRVRSAVGVDGLVRSHP
ncbi:SPOR domain-containing protein [Luteimonas fraxinea]|uniref:SPOR domain-containing protein n=1 Tax=Luteimonas fraxinea TaxID=2901869 RepID=UPI001E439B7F|nr:SPOR domain-containing protein [Luteimonas fraxinea]MCD9124616.1 SPOR domain-containing protein [Luteimonas fraxinea]